MLLTPRRGFLDFRRSLAYLYRLRLGSQPSKPRTAPAIISIVSEQVSTTSAISFRFNTFEGDVAGRPECFRTGLRVSQPQRRYSRAASTFFVASLSF
jgi:hypothetical protein